jgi:hypothetical protein
MPEAVNIATKNDDIGRPQVNATEKKFGSSSTSPFQSDPFSLSPHGDIKDLDYMRKPPNPVAPSPRGLRKTPRIYLNKFRVPIYIQLCVVICILCGLCVMVVAVTTVFPTLSVV